MSNANLSTNELSTNTNNPNTNGGMGRSVSSARFQIAKVSDTDGNTETSLDKTASIPHSMSRRCMEEKQFIGELIFHFH